MFRPKKFSEALHEALELYDTGKKVAAASQISQMIAFSLVVIMTYVVLFMIWRRRSFKNLPKRILIVLICCAI